MNSSFASARRLADDIEKRVRLMESQGSAIDASLLDQLRGDVELLRKRTNEVETMMAHEDGDRRRMWKRKVDSLFEECEMFAASVMRAGMRMQKKQQEEESREALLGNRDGAQRRRLDEYMTGYREEAESLTRSGRAISEMLEKGGAVLESLHRQGEGLKNVQRKMLDVANVLGLSQSTIRLIERRTQADHLIVYAGILICSVLIFTVYRYTGKL